MSHSSSKGWALITGASSGIGESFAHALAREGYSVYLVARREDKLRTLAEQLSKNYKVGAKYQVLDLSRSELIRPFFDALPSELRFTLLINNAGFGRFIDFKETPWNDQKQMIDLNIGALTELAHRFVERSLKQQITSQIVNVASIGAYTPAGQFAVYGASKAYVRTFSLALREELKPFGIQVNLLCPGGTITEFSAVAGQDVTSVGQSALMTADECVRLAMKGMKRNQAVIIPGFFNQLICFFPRLLSDEWSARIGTWAMKLSVKRSAPRT